MSGHDVQRNEAGREFARLRGSDFASGARSLQREKLVLERYYIAACLLIIKATTHLIAVKWVLPG